MSDFDPADDQALDDALAAAAGAPSPDDSEIDDGLLSALREGRLDDERTLALETQLAADPGGRALLHGQADADVERLVAWAGGQEPTRRGPWRWAGPALALAAGVLIAVALWRPASTPDVSWSLSGPYGYVKTTRSDTPGAVVYRPGTRVGVDVVPSVPTASVRWTAYVVPRGGTLSRAPAPTVVPGAEGAARLEWPAEALFGNTPGQWTVVLVPDDTPTLVGRSPAAARDEAAPWLQTSIEYRASAP
jgi:hypothetical protein